MPNDAGEVDADDVKRMWESLLTGSAHLDDVKTWAEQHLTGYDSEPTFRGLYRLVTGRIGFAAYCDWVEIVNWYRDDPAAWNKWYFLRYAAAMKAVETSRKLLRTFLEQGVLRPDDPDVATYASKIGVPI